MPLQGGIKVEGLRVTHVQMCRARRNKITTPFQRMAIHQRSAAELASALASARRPAARLVSAAIRSMTACKTFPFASAYDPNRTMVAILPVRSDHVRCRNQLLEMIVHPELANEGESVIEKPRVSARSNAFSRTPAVSPLSLSFASRNACASGCTPIMALISYASPVATRSAGSSPINSSSSLRSSEERQARSGRVVLPVAPAQRALRRNSHTRSLKGPHDSLQHRIPAVRGQADHSRPAASLLSQCGCAPIRWK